MLTDDDLDELLESGEFDRNLQKEIEERDAKLKQRPQVDKNLERTWVYPNDLTRQVRQYQYEISHSALFDNTLVCIPTGLGKTFIASVVMYNYYRWFPTGKIVFVLPTLSLVFQQHKACAQVVHFLRDEVATMTGSKTKPKARKEIWKKKRVFFSTASIVVNDLRDGVLPADQVVLLVFDEAHKATYNHDYCTIIKSMAQKTSFYRVLALSATPGKDMSTIQQVISNLQISKVEARTEEDLQRYSHMKEIIVKEVALTEPIQKLKELFFQIVAPSISTLNKCGAYYESDLEKVSYQSLFAAHTSFIGSKRSGSHIGMAMGAFGVAIKFFHCYSDLITQDLNVFIQSWEGIQTEAAQKEKKKNKNLTSILQQPLYHTILRTAKAYVNQKQEHPKLVELGKTIKEHFSKNIQTKVIIFASQKLTVKFIVEYLSRKYSPLIRAMEFIGQNKGKHDLGLTAKEQVEVIDKFTRGNYNVLVSTSVGEEGIDIGEVDMIICYDAVTSPTRLIQRMGRTGRKREGTAVMILTEGYEVTRYQKSQENSLKLFEELKKLSSKNAKCKFYEACPRMISYDVEPQCVHQDLSSDLKSLSLEQSPSKKKRKQLLVSTTDRRYLQSNYGQFKPKLGNFYKFLSSNLSNFGHILTPCIDIPHSDTLKALVYGSQRRMDYTYDWSMHKVAPSSVSLRPQSLYFDSELIKEQVKEEMESERLPEIPTVVLESDDWQDVGKEQVAFLKEQEELTMQSKVTREAEENANEQFGADPYFYEWIDEDSHNKAEVTPAKTNVVNNPAEKFRATQEDHNLLQTVFQGLTRPLLIFNQDIATLSSTSTAPKRPFPFTNDTTSTVQRPPKKQRIFPQ